MKFSIYLSRRVFIMVVFTTARSKAVVPVLVGPCVELWHCGCLLLGFFFFFFFMFCSICCCVLWILEEFRP